jgi:hypothetical protein
MGRYRKVDSKIWNDDKFRSLTDDAKLVFLFILTHPHMTGLGAMRATIPGLAAELGWSAKAFREAFGKPSKKGMIEVDEDASFVGLPRFLKYNGPESPNVVKSWAGAVDLIPECELKVQLLERVKGYVEGLGPAFNKALPKAIKEHLAGACFNPEQEQEQEQEPIIPPNPPYTLMDLIAEWNLLPEVRKAMGTNAKRKRDFTTRWKEEAFRDGYQAALAKFPLKCFSDNGGWRPDVDWFLRPGKVTEILEGKFDWVKSTQTELSLRLEE